MFPLSIWHTCINNFTISDIFTRWKTPYMTKKIKYPYRSEKKACDKKWNVCMWRWQNMNRLSIFIDTIEFWCFQWSETHLFIHLSLVLQMTMWFIKCIVSFWSHARCCQLLGTKEHSPLQQLNRNSFCSVFINTDFFIFCVNLYSVKLKSLKNC